MRLSDSSDRICATSRVNSAIRKRSHVCVFPSKRTVCVCVCVCVCWLIIRHNLTNYVTSLLLKPSVCKKKSVVFDASTVSVDMGAKFFYFSLKVTHSCNSQSSTVSYGTFLIPHSVLWMWVRSTRGLYQRDEQGKRDRVPKPHRIYKSGLSMCWISSLPAQMLDSLVAARHSGSPSRGERGRRGVRRETECKRAGRSWQQRKRHDER